MIVVPEASSLGGPAFGVVCLPGLLHTNPYQRLLYDSLESEGFVLTEDVRLKVGSLVRGRRRARILHFHWPELQYRQFAGPQLLRGPLAAARLAVVAGRLAIARILGFRVVWTVHQVYPHERSTPLVDRVAARLLAVTASRLIVHDEATRTTLGAELGPRAARKVRVIPHGSYVDVYPAGRPRADARAALALDEQTFVFLSFGHIRAYKGIDLLLAAFAEVREPAVALIVAGMVHDATAEQSLREAAAADPRIRLELGFVPDDAVGDLFAAADVAVVSRPDGGTSGSLVLALSQGLPVVAAETAAYGELVGAAGWLFTPDDEHALTAALEAAAAGREAVCRERASAADPGRVTAWPAVAAATAAVFREALAANARAPSAAVRETT